MKKNGGKGPLGANIQHLRELRGKSVPDIARDLELPEKIMALTLLESRNSTRSALAPLLAEYYGVALEVLVTKDLRGLTAEQILSLNVAATGKKVERARAQAAAISAERDTISGSLIQTLLSLFLQSTDEGRQAILDAAELAPKVRG